MDISLDWRSIAGAVAPIAPKLGAVLGTAIGGLAGPIGAGIGSGIGSIAGRAIAAKFGVEATPEAVGDAIASDPQAREKLAQLERQRGDEILAQAQIEIERIRQAGETARTNVTEINATIRDEAARGVSWWHWRHLIGYVTVAWGVQYLVGTTMLMVMIAINPLNATAAITAVTALITATIPIFLTLAALNGYVAADTTNRINTAITGEHSAGGLLNTVRAVATKKKA